jgi:hypothetical protein
VVGFCKNCHHGNRTDIGTDNTKINNNRTSNKVEYYIRKLISSQENKKLLINLMEKIYPKNIEKINHIFEGDARN